MEPSTIKIGTRSSKLALTQTGNAVQKLADIFPNFAFETVPFSSPGDRDQEIDLKISDPDFFTRDLDDALVNGDIAAGVHSAKDLPEEINPALDWFWLPWNEDQRDILVMRKDEDSQITKSPDPQIRIGVSSERREEYCRRRFPDAELLPIRGNIEGRIAQLDDGKYDLLIMAAAGLKRLGLHDRIAEYISLEDMPPPAGQGYLAVTFRKGDRRFEIMRSLFVQPVVFAGSGPGDPELATAACIGALKHCGICLYDSLAPVELLEHLPENAEAVYVGKRSGKHSKKQGEICQLITQYARQGKAVVRLKGGDAGIFGRLAEEIDALDELSMPYRVIPGISSMQSASASTGLLLTRRGISRGFSVMTPRRTGSADYEYVSPEENLKFPRVYFMGKSVLSQITEDVLQEGCEEDVPAAVVFSAGSDAEFMVTGQVANIAEKVKAIDDHDQPGLLIVGSVADEKFLYQQNAPIAGEKILVTCSENLQEKACCEVRKYGGKAIPLPLIKFKPVENFCAGIERYDYLLLTSPGAVKIFLENADVDVRKLPKIMVCGPGTADAFHKHSIFPEVVAVEDYGRAGLILTAREELPPITRILRLCSDKAGEKLSCELRKLGCEVEDRILYHNIPQQYENLPEFDGVIFASSSAVKAFVENFGIDKVAGKIISVIGDPTLETVNELLSPCEVVKAREATIPETVSVLAEYFVNEKLIKEFVQP